MSFVRHFPALLLALFTLGGSGCAGRHTSLSGHPSAFAANVRIDGISDFGKVNDFLYRGSQPNRQGLEALKELGVDTIVDLRGERHGTMLKERSYAQSLGMRLVNIPGNGWSPPTDEQVAEFFSLLREVPRRKVYVHCWFGNDRSGVFIAVYRIAFDGWTPEQALDEMDAFHFKGFWHPAMKKYIRAFPARLEHSAVLASFRRRVVALTHENYPDVARKGNSPDELPAETERSRSVPLMRHSAPIESEPNQLTDKEKDPRRSWRTTLGRPPGAAGDCPYGSIRRKGVDPNQRHFRLCRVETSGAQRS